MTMPKIRDVINEPAVSRMLGMAKVARVPWSEDEDVKVVVKRFMVEQPKMWEFFLERSGGYYTAKTFGVNENDV